MGTLFNLDNPVWSFMGKVADLILLNLLAVVCSIPIFTIGASWTALYFVTIRMVRKEEGYVIRDFFRSFKENFKQATIIWGIGFFVICFLAYDWYLLWNTQQIGTDSIISIALLIVSVLVIFALISVFPFLARFQVSTKAAIRNAIWFGVLHIPQMLLILLMYAITVYICCKYMEWLVLAWVVGTGLTLFYSSRMFVKAFAKLEPKTEISDTEEQEVEEVL